MAFGQLVRLPCALGGDGGCRRHQKFELNSGLLERVARFHRLNHRIKVVIVKGCGPFVNLLHRIQEGLWLAGPRQNAEAIQVLFSEQRWHDDSATVDD